MKFVEFKIKNFKGIKDITINFQKSPKSDIYTLVGLNESGKTTILEAINTFDPSMDSLTTPQKRGLQPNTFIPMNLKDNFNGIVYIEAKLELDSAEMKVIESYAKKHTHFDRLKKVDFLRYYRYYKYKDSKFTGLDSKWDGFSGHERDDKSNKFVRLSSVSEEDNLLMSGFCKQLIPRILYFPNFLFDFPSKIYLETREKPTEAQKLYIDLIQDILYSIDDKLKLKTHLIKRIKSKDPDEIQSLKVLKQKMERKVTGIVFGAWNEIFKKNFSGARIKIDLGVGPYRKSYLAFEIEANDGIFNLNQRSLGFRWFFTFLLFTKFRTFRKGAPENVIYLFDEPASNLHPNAQMQLLRSFSNLGEGVKILYTTHSHYLINRNWLESTYVVGNEAIDSTDPDIESATKTDITITPYREFISKFPAKISYIQPVLETLDYAPSDLEAVPNCIFLEGKNDFYILKYFNEVIFENRFELNFSPGISSSSLDTLISLYIGWGKDFIVMLDSDKAGISQRDRYVEKFGKILEPIIFTLENVDINWKGSEIEDLFDKSDLIQFQKTCYIEDTNYNKSHFCRAIQENLMTKRKFDFSASTKDNFEKTLNFLHESFERR